MAERSSTADDAELLARFRAYRAAPHLALRDAFVYEHLPLVSGIAWRYSGMGEPLEDLIQEGTIGLLRAVDHFDPDRGAKFSTYASYLITHEMLRHLRDRGHLIRQPAWVQELNRKVTKATEQLTQRLERAPTPGEIAESLNLTEESVCEVLAARELTRVVSMTTPVEDSEDSDLLLIDKEKIRTRRYETGRLPIEDRIVLEEAIAGLKALERKVLRLFFYEDLNRSQIARRLGISVSYSSYLLNRSIQKVKAGVAEGSPPAAAAGGGERAAVLPPANFPVYDQITGAYSAPFFRCRVAEEIARGERYLSQFSLMLLRLHVGRQDREKTPAVLALFGRFLRQQVRAVDVIAYMGSATFSLLLPGTGDAAQQLGERLCRTICQDVAAGGLKVPISIEIGIAVFPTDGRDPETLFAHAERGRRRGRVAKYAPPSVRTAVR